jgi:Kdo-III transferase WaaZ
MTRLTMSRLDQLRKWYLRKALPKSLRHMNRLHPDFRLERRGTENDASYDIYWKGRKAGQTNPLSALRQPASRQCFIVATGPSLAQLDVSQLAGQPCFGVNGAIALAEDSKLSFQYHLVSDGSFVRDRFPLVRRMIGSGAECLFSFAALSMICELEPALLASPNLYLLPEMNYRYRIPQLRPEAFRAWATQQEYITLHPDPGFNSGRVGFSRDINQGVFTAQTVVFEALQVACYLKFRQVFILGLDLNASPGQARFYEQGDKVIKTRIDRDYAPCILPAFEVARDMAASHHIEIYNLSMDSRLPATVIPKISLEDAIGMT